MTIENIINELKVKREWTESTTKKYLNNVNKIKNCLKYEKDDIEFIKDYKKVVKCIEGKKEEFTDGYISTLFATIYSIIKDRSDFDDTLKTNYNKKMIKYSVKNTETRENNIKSEKEDKDWIEWPQLEKLIDNVPNQNFEAQFDYLLLLLYVGLSPLRSDYSTMIITFDEDYIEEDKNYLFIKDNNTIELVLNNFKNVKKLGVQRLLFNDVGYIIKFIKSWLKKFNMNKEHYLIATEKGKMIKANNFSKMFKESMIRLTGKPITLQLIRRIKESHIQQHSNYSKMTIKEKKEEHKRLLHSTNVAQQYNKLNNTVIVSDDINKNLNSKEEAYEVLRKLGYNINFSFN